MSEWWSEQASGMIFGVAGAVCGVIGGIFGSACAVLVPRGRGKAVVYGALGLIVAAAVAGVAIGGVGILLGQPRHVWMWPMLLGAVLLAAMLPSGLMIPKWYLQAELRRLEAGELRRSL